MNSKKYRDQAMARAVIAAYRDDTGYFDGSISYESMYEMFRYRYRFGEAETRVIIAALVNSGAEFSGRVFGDLQFS